MNEFWKGKGKKKEEQLSKGDTKEGDDKMDVDLVGKFRCFSSPIASLTVRREWLFKKKGS